MVPGRYRHQDRITILWTYYVSYVCLVKVVSVNFTLNEYMMLITNTRYSYASSRMQKLLQQHLVLLQPLLQQILWLLIQLKQLQLQYITTTNPTVAQGISRGWWKRVNLPDKRFTSSCATSMQLRVLCFAAVNCLIGTAHKVLRKALPHLELLQLISNGVPSHLQNNNHHTIYDSKTSKKRPLSTTQTRKN